MMSSKNVTRCLAESEAESEAESKAESEADVPFRDQSNVVKLQRALYCLVAAFDMITCICSLKRLLTSIGIKPYGYDTCALPEFYRHNELLM